VDAWQQIFRTVNQALQGGEHGHPVLFDEVSERLRLAAYPE